MTEKGRGKIIVIVAPSGTGKSTLIEKIKKDFPDIRESISYTTREKRKGERDGIEYFFVSIEKFKKMRDDGEFLEWAAVHQNFYGTSLEFVEKHLAKNHALLFDLDIQGAKSFTKHFGRKANIVFIAPPSMEILRERLEKRGTETQEIINIRMHDAEQEMLCKNDFGHYLVNDDFDRTVLDLKKIIHGILGE